MDRTDEIIMTLPEPMRAAAGGIADKMKRLLSISMRIGSIETMNRTSDVISGMMFALEEMGLEPRHSMELIKLMTTGGDKAGDAPKKTPKHIN